MTSASPDPADLPDAIRDLVAQARQWRDQGQHVVAAALLDRVLNHTPLAAEVWMERAAVDIARMAPEAAAGHVARALAVDPAEPRSLIVLTLALDGAARVEAGLTWTLRMLRLAPGTERQYALAGQQLLDRGAIRDAAEHAARALAINPAGPAALAVLGSAHLDMAMPTAATRWLDRLADLLPHDPSMAMRAAQARRWMGDFMGAARAFGRAAALDPGRAGTIAGLAQSLSDARARSLDLRWHGRAIALAPEEATPVFNRALALLARGDYAAGWPAYETRWATEDLAAARRHADLPLWRGEAIGGLTLLLHAEQGHGDALQFMRLGALAKARGARVVVEAPRPLRRLFAEVPWIDALIDPAEARPPADRQCPMMSLPAALGLRVEDLPGPWPYLTVPDEAWRQFGAPLATGSRPRVGVIWSGAPRRQSPRAAMIDRRRSVDPGLLSPLADLPIELVALQFEEDHMPNYIARNGALGWRDFADASAAIAAMDAIVSVDTAMAHLAGALGKPVFLLSRYDGCWRWFDNRAESPWYPSLRVHGQDRPGDWSGAIARLRADLAGFLSL